MSQEGAKAIARDILDLSSVEPVNPHDLATIVARYEAFCRDIIPHLRALKSNLGDIGFMLVAPNNVPGASFMDNSACQTFVASVMNSAEAEVEPLPPEPIFRDYVMRLANNVLNSENG